MSSPTQFIEDAVAAAKRAVQFDSEGQEAAAVYFYKIASKLLNQAADVTSDGQKAQTLRDKANEYNNRAVVLDNIQTTENDVKGDVIMQWRRKCHFLMQQALDADSAGLKDVALELYMKAIEFVAEKPDLMRGELKEIALQAIERAEVLKGIDTSSNSNLPKPTTSVPVKSVPSPYERYSSHPKITGHDGYTDEEKLVLCHGSTINNREYVPFMNIDLTEKFQYAIPFSDKDGLLALSPKQQHDFARWVRPDELCSEPCIVHGDTPNYMSIKQTIVSDCSFVASLAVSALYEKRFGRKLVTAIIYPRSKAKKPLYNPFGKYMIKLHLNGVARKVIIDDLLPMNKYGQLLCSYSSNKNEFWISLLEKAYMKVMGGYDFPGSNSNIDLHALTGWIPERVAIKLGDPDFNKDALFSTLESRMYKGDALVTVATGELSDVEAERSGLVATHAYAVLEIRSVKGMKLLKLKNPWSHLRWKGRYSELDLKSWTEEMQQLCNYDPHSAAQFDNGVFWIDYESICHFFDVFYMNWNPELFKYTYCIHQSWNAGTGPVKDLYTIGENPQFSLEVGEENSGAVWILLTRHITDIEDFKENKEFIAVLVYKGSGKRVYYPNDPPPYINGVRINSPHYLCKIILGPNSSKKYTLVVSQYEKSQTIYYTLRAYSTGPFILNKIIDPFICHKKINDEWKGTTAGGCSNHPITNRNNPSFRLEIDSVKNDNKILIELKGPKQYQIGFDVTFTSVNDDTVTAPFKTISSGAYRSGYVVVNLDSIPSGSLQITPSTFLPNQEGPFILNIKSTASIKVMKLV